MIDTLTARTGRRLLAGAALAALTLAAPTAASAADGTTTIRFGGAGARALDGQKVTLSGLKPATPTKAAKASRARVSLPVSGGSVSATSATVRHGGRIRLRAGGRSAVMTDVQVRLGGTSSRVTARLGRSTVTLLTLKPAKGRAVTLDAAKGSASVVNAAGSLPEATATRLRSALKVKRLSAGRLATVTVRADLGAQGGAPVAPTPTPIPVPTPTPDPTPPTPQPPVPTPDPPTPAPPLVCDPIVSPALDQGADWSFKETFLSYVQGPIAHGSVGCTGGATGSQAGGKVSFFRFGMATEAEFESGAGTLDAAFPGTIAFRGHDYGNGPLLEMSISNLRITLDGQGAGTILADLTSRPFTGMNPGAPAAPVESHPDVHLADLDLTGISPTEADGKQTWSAVPVTLSADGAEAFGGFYETGEVLAPITFAVATAD